MRLLARHERAREEPRERESVRVRAATDKDRCVVAAPELVAALASLWPGRSNVTNGTTHLSWLPFGLVVE